MAPDHAAPAAPVQLGVLLPITLKAFTTARDEGAPEQQHILNQACKAIASLVRTCCSCAELLRAACTASCARCGQAAAAAAEVVVFPATARHKAARAAAALWHDCDCSDPAASSAASQPASETLTPHTPTPRQPVGAGVIEGSGVDELVGAAKGSGAPLCWMWGELARAAVQRLGARCFVLLGDDTEVAPAGWPGVALHAFDAAFGAQDLGCLVLRDAVDPGYPSFPVLGAQHLQAFGGQLLPPLFLNQVGDPFLAELYRRAGLLHYCHNVTVTNKRGGLQLPDDQRYNGPLYQRVYPPQQLVLRELDAWSDTLLRYSGRAGMISVDVLVPCGRADAGALQNIIEACCHGADEGADVRFGVVVDQVPCPEEAAKALLALKADMPDKLRLRFNATNLGASGTRNKLMEESLAQLLVMLDDDVVPQPACVTAYVRAFRQQPQAAGFAGSSTLELPPAVGKSVQHTPAPTATAASTSASGGWSPMQRVVALGVHMADVAFFWDAATTLGMPQARAQYKNN